MNHRSEAAISRFNCNEAPLVWPAHHKRCPNPVSSLDHLSLWLRTAFRVSGLTEVILLAMFSSRWYVAGHEVDWCRNALKDPVEFPSVPKPKARIGIRLKFFWYSPVRKFCLGYKANENFLKKFSSRRRTLLSVKWIPSNQGSRCPNLPHFLTH